MSTTTPAAGPAFRAAARLNLKRPFSTLLLLSLFITVASGTIADATEAALVLALVLLVVETYVEIAAILAAAEDAPEASGDVWIRAAFRQRTFWRYTLTGITVSLVTAIGFMFLLVPGFFLAARLGLAQAATVLEGRLTGSAISRSTEISAPARRTIAILFGLVLVLPAMGLQALAYSSTKLPAALLIPLSVASVIAARIALVALTRIFTHFSVQEPSG